jgi:RNA polymerase sigma-70 factor (ECF subfamily)
VGLLRRAPERPSDRGEAALLERLRAGDEAAFMELVDRYQASLIRVALMYVPTRAVAEDVVQETWLGVVRGIERFEGRSSFKTWLYRILVNRARTRGRQEARSVPFSSLAGEGEEPAVEPERFAADGGWDVPDGRQPHDWGSGPLGQLLAGEARDLILGAISELPPAQRQVVTLRDVEGWSAAEACNALDLTETNQRVLLHRGRSKVRRALERYFDSP